MAPRINQINTKLSLRAHADVTVTN